MVCAQIVGTDHFLLIGIRIVIIVKIIFIAGSTVELAHGQPILALFVVKEQHRFCIVIKEPKKEQSKFVLPIPD